MVVSPDHKAIVARHKSCIFDMQLLDQFRIAWKLVPKRPYCARRAHLILSSMLSSTSFIPHRITPICTDEFDGLISMPFISQHSPTEGCFEQSSILVLSGFIL
jgi:hypothetical protein